MTFKALLAAGKMKIAAAAFVASAVAGSLFYYTKTQSSSPEGVFDNAFKPYISGFTGGVISKESAIVISFTSEVASSDNINLPLDEDLFDFDPSIQGTLMWTDKSTLKFQPANPLESGKLYKAQFEIGKVMQMPENLQVFRFDFRVMEQNYDVVFDGLRYYDKGGRIKAKLVGSLITADIGESEDVEKILQATQNNKTLKIHWDHQGDHLTHRFEIDSITRAEADGIVKISWDGSSIGSSKKGTQDYPVPAIGNFILVSAKAVQGEEQYAELEFSDPLLQNQDLEGLVTIKGVPDIRIIPDQNMIRVYPPVRQSGVKKITIQDAVKNIDGKRLGKTQTIEILFEEIKPSVRLIGKGVILPSTDGMIFPFEAVSLKSVEVKITKIHENNINQFFQVNNYAGKQEIKRVGTVVVKKTVNLNNTNPNDYSRWKRYALDLSDLMQAEQGAIYQVKIGFKKKNTWYTCSENSEEGQVSEAYEDEDDNEEQESSYWDYSEDYYYEYDYDYSQRENPCHHSYYGDFRSVTRNILSSDLGLIAKKGASGEIDVTVTDLKTTAPISSAIVEIYDFQQQLLVSKSSDGEGFARFESVKKPYFIIVKKDNQRGYLKLDDGSSLSVSAFDVTGEKIKNGIKGFIYGERGVWRPGDSLFLTFILENKLNSLPANQPVLFELVNPMGQTTKRLVSATPVDGFYNFSTATSEDDPTGNWLARVKVGGAVFTKPIKIETIKPNRLKIKMDFGKEKVSASDNQLNGELDVKWLHGAIAKNLRADVSMILTARQTQFEKYPEYVFDDPARSFESETIEIFNGRINEEGKAEVSSQVFTEGIAPGVLNANFKVKVFEEGGDFSTDQFSLPYYPYKSFLGMRLPEGDKARNMLLTDTNHVINLVALDENGKLVSGNRKLEIEVYKLAWKWWWDKSEDDISNVLSNSYYRPVQKHDLTLVNGKGTWNLRINYPEWGRFYVRAYDKESKHSTGKIFYIDWPGWAGKSRENTNGTASMLNFTTDKAGYQVGENINLTIPGSANGRALISIESGSKVLKSYWLETVAGKNNYTLEATEDMAPNAYINITLLQPHSQTVNDLPMRLYGIMPVKVENPNTILKPVINTASEYRPEEPVNISVSEATGKPMTYTLAVVDEGLLDLTRFKTPDPWANFYAREALGVKSFDLYDFVIGALGQKVDKILTIGGDGEIAQKEKGKAKRFPPVVKFLGPFKLDAGETAKHTFIMPQYIGSVRVMIVAGNSAGAYGNVEKAVPVRKPLMLLATLPRVMGPEEYVALPVSLFAMTANIKNVNVQVKTDNLLEIKGENQKNISFTTPGDEVVNFYLKAKAATGTSKVTVTASSGSEKATYTININIRNPNTEVTRVTEKVLQPGETFDFEYASFGVTGSNKGILEVSSIPPVNLGKRLNYLITYPYGCIEQTTSSVFPQLFVMDVIQSDEVMAKRIQEHVKAGIVRLRSFQLSDGGFGYWPGAEEYNAWSTNYVGHFLIEAERKGYSLPTGMKDNWKSFQKKMARNWNYSNHNSDLVQAYRLYTLALAGDPEKGAMNRLRERKDLSAAAVWRLAAAYILAGQQDVAEALIKGASLAVPEYSEMDNTYGSGTRDKAMILEVLALAKMQTQGFPLLKELSGILSSQKWMSTQETAFTLLAISKFANSGIKASKVNFYYAINGGSSVNAVTEMKIAQVDLKLNQTEAGKVTVKNNSQGTLYFRTILSGIPAAGSEEAASNNLALSVKYKTKEGQPINVSRLQQGTDFVAEVTITNPGLRGDLKNLALKQIFASGWEIHNFRMDNGVSNQQSSIPTYQDIRDDRVYTYFDLKPKESKTFRLLLNASYLGKYYLPAVYSEAMYDGTINATEPGKWVEVVEPGNSGEISYTE